MNSVLKRVPLSHWLLAGLLLVCRVLAMRVLFIFDDAYITFRYARNLTQGLGLVYNAGEHVLGTTTPFFALLLTPFFLAGLPMPASVLWFNIALDLAILLWTLQTLLREEAILTKILFGLLFALSARIARVTLGGMEMSLFLLVSLVAIWLFERKRPLVAISLAAASYFIRPEGALLTALLIMFALGAKHWKLALRMVATTIAIVAIPLLVIHAYYGSFLSQSVMAKLELRSVSHSSLAEVLAALYGRDPLSLVLLPFAILSAIRISNRTGIERKVLAWIVVYTLFYCVSRPYMFSWYGEVCYWGILFFGSIGIVYVARWLFHERILNWIKGIGFSAGALVLAIWLWIALAQGQNPVQRDVYDPLYARYNGHINPNETILASDIGAIGYYSGAHIYDLFGLVTPGLTPVHSRQEAIEKLRPDYIYQTGAVPLTLSADSSGYAIVANFVAVYPEVQFSPMRHWTVEYHLLKRK